MHIALLEDDEDQAELVQLLLANAGYQVEWFAFGVNLLEAAATRVHSLYILDWLVPGLNGIGVVKRLRAAGIKQPVLFLTQFDSSENAADAIAAGADDYVVKSSMQYLLVARVHALLNGAQSDPAPDVAVGRYQTAAKYNGVMVAGRAVWLDPLGFALARLLLTNPERLVTRSELMRSAANLRDQPDPKPVEPIESKMRELSTKLQFDGSHGLRMREVHRVGYRLEASGN